MWYSQYDYDYDFNEYSESFEILPENIPLPIQTVYEINALNDENFFSLNNELTRDLFNTRNINLSIGEQLEGVLDNLAKYEAEKLKFKGIINNINNDTELFYPPESKILFLQYLDLIDFLIDDLRSREKDFLSNLPSLPEETPEEREYLSSTSSYAEETNGSSGPEDYLEDVNSWGMLDEKEHTPEDYMEDVNSWGMFDEKEN